MRKRIICFILTLVLLIGVMPPGVTAAMATEKGNAPGVNGTIEALASEQDGTYLAITCDIHYKYRADFAVDETTGEVIGTKESVERMVEWLDKASADYGGIVFEQLVSCGDQGDANTSIRGEEYWNRVGVAMDTVENNDKVLGDGFFINGNHEWQNGQYNTYKSSHPAAMRIHEAGYVEEGQDYILYSLSAAQTNNSFNTDDITALDNYLKTAPTGKPIFIVSHYPLHNYNRTEQRRDDVINVLNKYADTLQIIFLWGHNHTEEDPNYGIVFTPETGYVDNLPMKFTYCSAGCMTDDEYDAHAVFTKPKGMVAYISPDHTVSLTYYDVNYEQMSTTTLTKPAGHNFVKTDAKEATCTADGISTDCWYCSGCERYFSDEEGQNEITADSVIVSALGHNWDEGVVTTEPTEETEGVRTFTCLRCGETKLKRIARIGAGPVEIDFTDPADADNYEIVGQTQSEVEEGVGLALICTRKSIEPAKRPNTGDYLGAEDVVEVPVEGDWTVTLALEYDPNGGGGSYAFFGFFASAGDDYQNMCGIRGGDGAMQNFEIHDGTVTHEDEDDVNSAPGFSEACSCWYQIEKTGDTYVCYRSSDGEEFTEMFSYVDSGIEATKLVIDAYSASSRGNGRKFTLKALTIDGTGGEIPDPGVDKTALEAAIADAAKIDKSAYTDDSVAAFEEALAAAEAAKNATKQSEVDAAVQALKDAIAALEEKPVKPDMTAIDDAVAAAEQLKAEDYTPESYAELTKAVEEAKAVKTKEDATQAEVDAAAKAVTDAIAALELAAGAADPRELNEAVAEAEKVDKDKYTEESIKALEEALAAAKAVQEKDDATQEEIDKAVADLKAAINALEPAAVTVDPSELNEAVAEAEKVDKDNYTEESVKALEEALDAAKAIQAKEDATQEEIDKAAADLKAAIAALEKKPEDFLFDDVKDSGKFYFDPVYWAFKADPQITNGVDKTHFGPDNSCTRGQVVTFLWRAAGCPEPKNTTTTFKDLKEGGFYLKAVAWAVENEITNGLSADKFGPDATCTRGQIVTFLWRFRGRPAPKNAATPFKDLKEGGFYLDAVAWAVENNITNGMSADKFAPDATCTRGQVVTFLYRATQG